MDKTKSGVLRFLGHRGQDVPENINALIDRCIPLMRDAGAPRHIKMTFALYPAQDGLALEGAGILLRGGDIARHLSGCGRCALFAATLGTGADSLIRRWERSDLTRALVLDACASQLIEEYCDEVEALSRGEAAALGLEATGRYSPGYGDFSLDIQPRLLDVLDAGRKIGLTCTQSLILLPRKSVTAIIGLGKNLGKSPSGCDNCGLRESCNHRKDGNPDGCDRLYKG